MRTRRSSLLFVYFCLGLSISTVIGVPARAQTNPVPNQWTWMGGSNTGFQAGVYGTLGTPAVGNIPSSRSGAAGWTDKSGNFWLYGGFGNGESAYLLGDLDDLWEFNPSTNQWSWMGGAYQIDEPGVFGTLGTPAAGNWPGGRQSPAEWTDASGNFWLFGGAGYDSADNWSWLNDLWEFNPSTGYWVWMGGSATTTNLGQGLPEGQPGIYGTQRTFDDQNVPSGRWGASSWTDNQGNLWLFGGYGFDSNGIAGELNDLWEYEVSTGQWAWMSGSNTVPTGLSAGTDIECGGSAPAPLACGQAGVYGTILTAAAGNVPGGRDSAVSWSDRDGNLWLFAGEGFDAVDKWGSLNDLWELAPSSDEWAWMGGDYVANGNPQFGTLGIPSVGNTPLGGYGMSSWVDAGGNIWTFGGNTGTDYETGYDLLWEFDIPTDEWALMNGGSTDGLPVYGTLGAPAPANIPGPRYGAVNWTDKAGNLWIFGGAGFAESGWSYLNDLWEYSPSAPPPEPSFAVYAWPGSVSVSPEGSGTAAVTTIVADGFSSPIGLVASGQPAGTTVSFSPSSITGAGTSQMIISVAPNTLPWNYPIVVSGTSGSATETATISFIVPAPTFALGASPNSVTVAASGSITSTITATVAGGFNSAISLTASGQPAGATVSFSPSSITGAGTSQMTMSLGSDVEAGTYSITVSGTGGSLTEASGVSLNVTAVPPTFSVATSPASLTLPSGGSGTTTVTITPANGFNSAVSFACSGLPSGAACRFSPTSVTPSGTAAGTTTLTVTSAATSAALHRAPRPLFPTAALAIALCCMGWKKRLSLRLLLPLAMSATGLGLITACGGGGSSGGGSSSAQPVTSIITVTATSGSLSQSTTFSLTVN